MSDFDISTIVHIPVTDLCLGMTLAYTLDGTAHARTVTDIDRQSALTLVWVGEFAFAVINDHMVTIEI
jgi:hypothetical protein